LVCESGFGENGECLPIIIGIELRMSSVFPAKPCALAPLRSLHPQLIIPCDQSVARSHFSALGIRIFPVIVSLLGTKKTLGITIEEKEIL